ncbi:hypothetical protein [Candidatus Neptunichlamydia sp. REUL1]|uniref:hypothetical protein n=1 Tax=Candidatus Neptunichlamydia sp. REUL1 TaxID=3064277 RepID=UPI002931DFF4|nr:hypothetical protein [Candidatus Neptunochlamydia sp. REUL1]
MVLSTEESGGKKNMDQDQLLKKIAKLESMCDQLQAEMRYLDQLLVEVGFEEGLKTLKAAAIELIDKKQHPSE